MPKKFTIEGGRREKTADEALQRLMMLCSKAERSSGDARRLMYRWGVPAADQQPVLDRLIKDRFIDDSRYAEAFVREKLRFSGWGAFKIRATLSTKGIARATIDNALKQIEPAAMESRLVEMLKKKSRTVKAANEYDKRAKLIRYGLSLGYDYDSVTEAVQHFINCEEPD